ncbi:MAG TPA: hypothetical protein VH042_10270 [Solirubrobacterales bacterium]|jgi:hypothetical protein|nr:hypothetical protein [Solirubrobacterales bacterium]
MVEQDWDPCEGEIKLKSSADWCKVPISAVLRSFLRSHLVAQGGWIGSDLPLDHNSAL